MSNARTYALRAQDWGPWNGPSRVAWGRGGDSRSLRGTRHNVHCPSQDPRVPSLLACATKRTSACQEDRGEARDPAPKGDSPPQNAGSGLCNRAQHTVSCCFSVRFHAVSTWSVLAGSTLAARWRAHRSAANRHLSRRATDTQVSDRHAEHICARASRSFEGSRLRRGQRDDPRRLLGKRRGPVVLADVGTSRWEALAAVSGRATDMCQCAGISGGRGGAKQEKRVVPPTEFESVPPA